MERVWTVTGQTCRRAVLCVITLNHDAKDVLFEGKGKTEVVPVHTMKAYRGSGGTAPHILNLSADLSPVKNPGAHWIGDWGGFRAGLDVMEIRKISYLCRDSNRTIESAAQYSLGPNYWSDATIM